MNRPFEGILGNNCELRLLEYLLPLEGIEFNITELAEGVGVSRVTATRITKKFVDWGVLNSTQAAGNIVHYSINLNSSIVKCVEQFNNALVEHIIGDDLLYEIHDYCHDQKPHPSARTTDSDLCRQSETISPVKAIRPAWLDTPGFEHTWQKDATHTPYSKVASSNASSNGAI